MKKYILTDNTREAKDGTVLYQIQALYDFRHVKRGDFGGWVEHEDNLAHDGDCWIAGNAQVYNDANVSGKAMVYHNACVRDSAIVTDYARVYDSAEVSGNIKLFGVAKISGSSFLQGDTKISGYAEIHNDIHLYTPESERTETS